MSFGSAAARRGRRLPAGAACPCGSGREFHACCGPILDGAAAASPEAIMRSRFTAFALGDIEHLEASWHPSTRPSDLTLDAGTRWTRLEIIRSAEDGVRGTVEFRAHWREPASGSAGELHETSRFRKLHGRWLYVDGNVT